MWLISFNHPKWHQSSCPALLQPLLAHFQPLRAHYLRGQPMSLTIRRLFSELSWVELPPVPQKSSNSCARPTFWDLSKLVCCCCCCCSEMTFGTERQKSHASWGSPSVLDRAPLSMSHPLQGDTACFIRSHVCIVSIMLWIAFCALFFKLKKHCKHYSTWYAYSSKHSYSFKHFRVFCVDPHGWLPHLPLTHFSNVHTSLFKCFHGIFVDLAFSSYWIISSGEIHISEMPGSFILIWLLVHIVRSPCKMSAPR